MKRAVFTIVSNNYYPRALALIRSLKEQSVDADIFLCLVDERLKDINYREEGFKIILLDEIGCERLEEMSFKYDVTEFNTAVKPFVFRYLFKNYDKILYIDPDIYVFNSLEYIFDSLENNSVVLTPHLCCANMGEDGDCLNETEVSVAGVFNLGFCGFKRSALSDKLIQWWCNKLQSFCFVDYRSGQFYDQKWMNYMPVLAYGELAVLKEPGYNLAPWNFCERELINEGGKYTVKDADGNVSPLYFLHFSGFNPNLPQFMAQKHIKKVNLTPTLTEVFEFYNGVLHECGYDDFASIPYHFATYENGDQVTYLHRQLYRGLVDLGVKFDKPFSVERGSFYALLKKKKLLDNHKEILKRDQVKNLDSKMSKVNSLMKFAKKILGVRRYAMLLRYMSFTSNLNHQIFLLGYSEKYEKDS